MRRLLILAFATLIPFGTSLAPVVGAQPAPSPAFTVPLASLHRAVECDPSVTATSGKEAVLLVHGTGGAAEGYWNWNYELALPLAGFGVCTVTIPGRATRNVAISAEYVAYAARYTYQRSGRPISMIGHSQGGTLVAWVAKFWPDVAAHTDDAISLSGDLGGIGLGKLVCLLQRCAAASWQLATGSHFIGALRAAPLAGNVDVTSIYSLTDEVVWPEPAASSMPGATAISVQQVCPGRIVDHITMLADAVGYALTLDALNHPGPANPSRVTSRARLCSTLFLPRINLLLAGTAPQTLLAFAVNLFLLEPQLTQEPPLPAYAAGYDPDPVG